MSKIIMVTGGARSGKSSFAENLVKKKTDKVTYIATAIAFDDGMKDRIKKHQLSRPSHWNTIEIYKDFERLMSHDAFNHCDVILFDCTTVMITNLMLDSELDFEKCSMDDINHLEMSIKKQVENLVSIIKKTNKEIVIVTNEVGMGLVPAYLMGNYFRDIQGRINMMIANYADEVYFMVSGIDMQIKGGS